MDSNPFNVNEENMNSPRPSVFDGVRDEAFNAEHIGGGDCQRVWSHVTPQTMPWSIPEVQSVYRFGGSDCPTTSGTSGVVTPNKRKSFENSPRPPKIMATADLMAEHFKNMSISNEVEEASGNFEEMSELPTLVMCPEIKSMVPVFEPVLPVSKKIWEKMEKSSSKALVLWKPQTNILGRCTFQRSTSHKAGSKKRAQNRKEKVETETSMED